MVSVGNLEYDYPVYWSKPLMEEGIDVAGATPQTRRVKRDKVLKDLSDKYVRLFNLILKRPDDYNLHLYFCNVRLKLDRYLILQMGLNYVYRLTYCEKAFQKFDRDLFCLDVINLEKFDRDAERFQFLCQDFDDFISRQGKVLRCISEDFLKYSSLTGDVILHKENFDICQKLIKANYISKVMVSRDFVNKILTRLLKERVKRKSAEDQTNSSFFLSDTPRDTDTLLDPGLPSVHPVSIETPSSSPNVSSENVSAEGKSKDKPSAPLSREDDPVRKETASLSRGGDSVAIAVTPPETGDGRRRLPDSTTALDSQSSTQSNPSGSALNPSGPASSSQSDSELAHRSLNFFKSLTMAFPTIIPVGLISILKVGLLRGLFFLPILLPLVAGTTFRDSISNVFIENVERLMVGDRMILPALIAALVVSYVFHYRKMTNRMVTAKLLLQVMVTFLSIRFLLDFFLPEVGLDKTNRMSQLETNDEIDSAAASDGPLTPPNADDMAWYYSKKVWGCIVFVGLAVAAVVYYLKGFAPVSPDDMATFRTAVSQGVSNVASEQVSLNQTLSDQVNSAAFRADMLNRTSEGMLSDIAAAGDAARQQLEQMTGVTQDFIHLHSRVDNVDDRMTALLRGIVYLISLRWVFNHRNSAPAAGSEVVNDVMSLERPFLFDSAISIQDAATDAVASAVTQTDEAAVVQTLPETTATAETSTQTDEAAVVQTLPETTATAETSTQTDETVSDQIFARLNPSITKYGEERVLFRLRKVLSVINRTLLSSDESSEDNLAMNLEDIPNLEDTSEIRVENTDLSGTSEIRMEVTRGMESTEHSPVTPTRSPVADSSDRLESIETVRSSDLSSLQSEITPRRLDDGFRMMDNPAFQPTAIGSPTPSVTSTHSSPPPVPAQIDPQNPYQFHRHNFFRLSRFFPGLWEFILNKL